MDTSYRMVSNGSACNIYEACQVLTRTWFECTVESCVVLGRNHTFTATMKQSARTSHSDVTLIIHVHGTQTVGQGRDALTRFLR